MFKSRIKDFRGEYEEAQENKKNVEEREKSVFTENGMKKLKNEHTKAKEGITRVYEASKNEAYDKEKKRNDLIKKVEEAKAALQKFEEEEL